jgi:hypothetical protein
MTTIDAVWVEIPVLDLDRALRFYQAVFGVAAGEVVEDGPRRTVTLTNTSDGGRPGFSLNQNAAFLPGEKGPLVYLDTGDDLTEHLGRVEPAGGTIVEGKTSMGAAGHYATFRDTEGNVLALYSVS